MALTKTNAAPVRNASRVDFYQSIKMMSGEQTVPVVVRDEALQKLASPQNSSKTPDELLAIHRAEIENVASRKHSAGQIESDGSVWITAADV